MNSTEQLSPGLHNRSHSRIRLLSGLLVLVSAAVITVHWPALSAKTLSFDDHQYLVENELVKNPSLASAGRFLKEVLEPSTVQGYYQPLTMISLMLDYAASGSTDYLAPFHRTSLALHTANTALIIVLLYLLFGRPLPAAAAGILFGLHPMTVEPIPWIGERKTLLAAFFALWCLIFYIQFTRKRNWKFYICCLGMYVLSLMSKPTSTPLPVLMLFLDYWPLKRLKRRCLLEKLPFFAIGFISAMITYISQDRTIGTRLPTDYSLVRIPLILCHNIIFYPFKMIWPAKLSSHYAFPEPLSLSHPMVLTGVIGTLVLVILLIASMRWTRAVMTGWLFFFTAIFPTMGIIGFTNVIASDKFAYLPSIGLLMVLTAFLNWLCKTTDTKIISRRIAAIIIVVILAVTEATATRRYLAHWQNTESYYKHMLTLTPRAASLHFNLAYELQSQNRLDEAAEHYLQALSTNPNDTSSHNNLGGILQSQGKLQEAIEHYKNALQIEPDNVNSHTALGTVLSSQGKLAEATACFHLALEIKPDFAPAHYNLANTLVVQDKLDEAITHYGMAVRFSPDYAPAQYNLGILLQRQGKLDKAISHYRLAIQADPEFAQGYYSLGNALAAMGEIDEAIRCYRQALQIKPDYAAALGKIARIWATHPNADYRDINQATQLAERAAQLTEYKVADILDTLAAAYAAGGQLDKALETAQKALGLALSDNDKELANHIRKQMETYKKTKP